MVGCSPVLNAICPSCQADYEFDPARIPPGGVPMRCPKCGARFRVTPGGVEPVTPDAAASRPLPPPVPGALQAKGARRKKTIVGVMPPLAPPPPRGDVGEEDSWAHLGDDSDAPGSKEPTGEVDLPAPAGGGGGGLDLDLPVPAPPGGEGGVDLPAPAGGGGGELDLDLPAPLPAGGGGGGLDLDLPAPAPPGDEGGVDLPAPAGGVADLPSPAGGGGGELDLDLPVPSALGDLPAPAGGVADLPSPAGGGGGELDLDLPVPSALGDLPAPAGGVADLPVPSALGDLPAPAGGVADLPSPGALEGPFEEEPGDFDSPPGAGTERFGELDLGDGGAEEGLEFDELTEGPGIEDVGGLGLAQGERLSRVKERMSLAEEEERTARRAGRRRLFAVAFVLAVLAVGFALRWTPYGVFGVYAVERFLPAAGSEAAVREAISRAERRAVDDTFVDVRAALRELGGARRRMPLARALWTRSLVHLGLYTARFGAEPWVGREAARLRARLAQRGDDAPGMALAEAAEALRERRPEEGGKWLARARAEAPRDPYVALVAGETALARSEGKEALEAFRRAVRLGAGARGQWGVARALRAAGAPEEAYLEAVKATLALSPNHTGALLARAEHDLAAARWTEAERAARRVAGLDGTSPSEPTLVAPRGERARAWVVLGAVREHEGDWDAAARAYRQALRFDAYLVPAMLGVGRVGLRGGEARRALGYFESALQALQGDASGREDAALELEAVLGAARAEWALGEVGAALARLRPWMEKAAHDARVPLLLGELSKQRGDLEAAERMFRTAIERAPKEVEPVAALAELLFEAGRTGEAEPLVRAARRLAGDDPRALARVARLEVARGRLEEAIALLRRAARAAPEDPFVVFRLGAVLRRAGRLQEAAQQLERAARLDPTLPGLAVERGRLFEARGEAKRAVRAYRKALQRAPDDLDLRLRLAAALLETGAVEESKRVIEPVLKARPHSAEATYFHGRIEFATGHYPEALSSFERAVQLDARRPEYFLWLAKARIRVGSLGPALEAVEQALRLDDALGEAYVLRGTLRLRAGQVRDALGDFDQALRRSPKAYDALAGRGDALEQMGDRRGAKRAYEQALSKDPSRGDWWFRLGRIRADLGDRRGALAAVDRAVAQGTKREQPPRWLVEAYRLRGELKEETGRAREAVADYRRYLELAPPGDLDRDAVERRLERLGGGDGAP